MDKGGAAGLSGVSRSRPGANGYRAAAGGAWEKSRHRQTHEGLGAGVYEIALAYRGNAYRVGYTVRLGADIWVVHAFQKKSKSGIKTPQPEIDLIISRLKRLKEMLS
jgi:phage-related protein